MYSVEYAVKFSDFEQTIDYRCFVIKSLIITYGLSTCPAYKAFLRKRTTKINTQHEQKQNIGRRYSFVGTGHFH